MSRIEIRSYSFSALLYCTVSQFLQRRCSRIMHMSKNLLKWTNTTNKWKFDRNTYRFIPLKAFSLRRKLWRLCVLYQLIALHDLRGFIYIFASLWIKCESHSYFHTVFNRVALYRSLEINWCVLAKLLIFPF